MKDTHRIVPSILAANFACLEQEIQRVINAGASILHLDIMDGHFVPNISFGPSMVRCVNALSTVTLDTHLMITNPEKYIEAFKEAGSDILTFHIEVSTDPQALAAKIRKLGMKAGITLNPETPVDQLEPILPHVDLALVMSVHPGFGGQKFIESSLAKVAYLKEMKHRHKLDLIIEIDGGIDHSTVDAANHAGAEYFVTGSAIFGNGSIEQNYKLLSDKILESHE